MTRHRLSFPQSFGRFWSGVGLALRASATRHDLAGLDDRMLKDLGISRAQAEFEASRRFWQTARHRSAP